MVEEPERDAVRDVEREPRRPPARPAGHGLAEDRDVRVVATEDPLVERLLQRPDGGCRGPRDGGSRPARHAAVGPWESGVIAES